MIVALYSGLPTAGTNYTKERARWRCPGSVRTAPTSISVWHECPGAVFMGLPADLVWKTSVSSTAAIAIRFGDVTGRIIICDAVGVEACCCDCFDYQVGENLEHCKMRKIWPRRTEIHWRVKSIRLLNPCKRALGEEQYPKNYQRSQNVDGYKSWLLLTLQYVMKRVACLIKLSTASALYVLYIKRALQYLCRCGGSVWMFTHAGFSWRN